MTKTTGSDSQNARSQKRNPAKKFTEASKVRLPNFSKVTDKIIADLKQGIRPWIKPWTTTDRSAVSLPVRHTGEPYRGVNVLMLWGEAVEKGYRSARWMTYRQALELGGYVRKGQSGTLVYYANNLFVKKIDSEGTENRHEVYLLRAYTVFNTEQIEGLPAAMSASSDTMRPKVHLIDAAEQFVAATLATIRHGGDRAYYTEKEDAIQLPRPDRFNDAESYAATQLHELIHWTKHARRLNRRFDENLFAYKGHSKEELVAELGAAFLCAHLGVTPEVREDHAAYIGHWLRILGEDNRAIFAAAANAQRAVDYLQSLQPGSSQRGEDS